MCCCPWSHVPQIHCGDHFTICHRLNIRVPAKFIRQNLTPNVMLSGGGAFSRWLGHEGSSHEWDQCSYKGDPREAPCPFLHLRTQREDGHPWIRMQVLTRHQTCWLLELELPSLQDSENEYMLFISHPAYGILFPQSKQTKTSYQS